MEMTKAWLLKKMEHSSFDRGKKIGWNDFITSNNNTTNHNLTWDKDILTICCRMKTYSIRHESVAITEIGIDRCSFQWNLNFPDCIAAPQTKKFSPSKTSQYEISMGIPNDQIEIKVKIADECLSPPTFLYGKIFLLDQDSVKVQSLSASERHSFDLTDRNVTWSFPQFITKEELEDYLMNETFSLHCEFSVLNGKESSDIYMVSSTVKKRDNVLILQEDLTNLFTTMKYSDVELRSENTTLPAHKSILATRSSVFSVMFDQDMIEKQSGVVDISDTDPETLKSFLEFVYSGTVVINDSKRAIKLLLIAEKYQVPSLKETCSIYLMSAITPGNVCEILVLADTLNLKQLKKQALDYFAIHMKEVIALPQWSNFAEKKCKIIDGNDFTSCERL